MQIDPIQFLTLQPARGLVLDQTYYLRNWNNRGLHPKYSLVIFVGFDSIPGLVFVRDSQGYVWRCLQEDLYSASRSIE